MGQEREVLAFCTVLYTALFSSAYSCISESVPILPMLSPRPDTELSSMAIQLAGIVKPCIWYLKGYKNKLVLLIEHQGKGMGRES